MGNLSMIETVHHIVLPDIYRKFYDLCSSAMPRNMIGTDLINNYSYAHFRDGAAELLENDGVKSFLDKEDFVFMMHQGYMFWYFKANGASYPIVYGYKEGKLKPDNWGCFSEFIKKCTS